VKKHATAAGQGINEYGEKVKTNSSIERKVVTMLNPRSFSLYREKEIYSLWKVKISSFALS
ncbi:MAG TPA: hypothetical protein VK369_11695, partial [Segetibacter sp.]|nr:hypothetical protein [Segetibacter sp.]